MQRTAVQSGPGDGEVRGDYQSIIGMLRRNVEARPEKLALASKAEGDWAGISYGELWERVKSFAAGLASLGVGSGAKVAIVSRSRPEWVVTDLAVQSLGAATVPVYPTLEASQVAHMLADSGAVVVVVEDQEILGKVIPERDVLPGLRHVILIDGDPGEVALPMDDIEARGESHHLPGWDEGWRSLERDDVATIIYTSGTTGFPKGVVLTHGNFLSNVEGVRLALPFWDNDVFLSLLPLSHVFERCGMYLVLSLGATTYYAESIQKVPENLREVRPTVALSVPRLYEKMRDRAMARAAAGSAFRRKLFDKAIATGRERYAVEREGRKTGAWLRMRLAIYDRLVFRKVRDAVGGRLRFFVSGGARLDPEVGKFFYAAGVKIVEGYGLTETSPVISCNRLPTPRFGTVGPQLDHTEVRVSDGEVQVRGPGVMRGYWSNPKATRGAFTLDGWYRTGDMGEIDDDGCLVITDRLKNLIVLSTGKNVAPQPIESAIVGAPSVSQSILLGDGRKYITALVAPDYDAVRTRLGTDTSDEELAVDEGCLKLVEEEIEEACRRFAGYERPKRIALLPRELSHEAGELTPTLKVKMRVVEERFGREISGLYAEEGRRDG